MYIKRTLEGVIKKYISRKEIIAVIGTRQSGKTTLVKYILSGLKKASTISFDDITALNLFRNDINSFIELYVKGYNYIFIDEIQYAVNSGKQLKYIQDTQKIKIFISGSSSTEISIQSIKYLVGRIFVFELYPFSFEEFLSFKNSKLYNIYIKKLFGVEVVRQIQGYINEYLIYGGYPRVVLSKDNDEKTIVLRNIYNTLLLHEVKNLISIGENDNLIRLIKALSLQIGNLVNYKELSIISGYNFPTLKKNMNILEALFICRRCLPFSKNPRKELVKNPKIYFVDLGLRNVIINNFSIERTDRGAMYENLIYTEFLKKGKTLNYWRTKSGAEVDFVDDGEPIEIKTSPKIGKSLHSFIAKYSPKKAVVISETEKETLIVKNTKINFYSFARYI